MILTLKIISRWLLELILQDLAVARQHNPSLPCLINHVQLSCSRYSIHAINTAKSWAHGYLQESQIYYSVSTLGTILPPAAEEW